MKSHGFTFIEVIVVMGVMATFLGIGVISLVGSQRKASVTQAVDTLVSDLRSQQTKAMVGATVGGMVPAGYGIYFQANRYVLFSGASYNSLDPSNASVPILSPLTISTIGFSGSAVIFLAKSGEVAGFTSGADSVAVRQNDSGQTKTIRLNRYGVVTSIN